jgi:hypothetical protein
MELRNRTLTPELFCVLVDSLIQTASLKNHCLTIGLDNYSHFSAASYHKNDSFMRIDQLLKEGERISQLLHRGTGQFTLGDEVISVKDGKINCRLRLYDKLNVAEIIPNMTRWFSETEKNEKELLIKIYRKGLGLSQGTIQV